MNIYRQNSFSVADAENDFSKVLQTVDRTGSAVIFKNNHPRYIVIEFSESEAETIAADEEIFAFDDTVASVTAVNSLEEEGEYAVTPITQEIIDGRAY